MSVQAIAAIDLGTTGCRAELFSLRGESLGRHAVEYHISTPSVDAAEQEAVGWWSAACECIRQALKQAELAGSQVMALGLSTQGHSWVPTDARFHPLRAAFTWLDRRSAPQAQMLTEQMGPEFWGQVAGKTPAPWHMLPQLLWLREHEPHVLQAARHLLFAQDFLLAQLTGKPVTDYTVAAASLVFDITQNSWSSRLLRQYGVADRMLAQVVPAGTVAGRLSRDGAAQMGLSTDTVAVVGAQDQKCAAFGAGLAPDIATASLGTATAISALVNKPVYRLNAPIPCFPYLQKGTWVLEAPISTTGGAINWLREALRPVAPDLSYAAIMDLAAQAPPGAAGVHFFPYLAGAGVPHGQLDARAAFSGLTLGTRVQHLARAVMEGVAYEIAGAVRAMQQAGCRIRRLQAFGGGVRSRLWCEIIAAAVDIPLLVCPEAETAVRGAAMLAAKGALPAEQAAAFQDALRCESRLIRIDEERRGSYQQLQVLHARMREAYWAMDATTRTEDTL